MSIPCPKCGSSTKTLETRTIEGATRRRRKCPDCGLRCTSVEQLVETKTMNVATPAPSWLERELAKQTPLPLENQTC